MRVVFSVCEQRRGDLARVLERGVVVATWGERIVVFRDEALFLVSLDRPRVVELVFATGGIAPLVCAQPPLRSRTDPPGGRS